MSDIDVSGVDTVLQGLDAYVADLGVHVRKAADEIAQLLASYAKSHHLWKPKTGATDASILGTVVDGDDIIEIYLSAGMDYDVFLELARDGKWSWLWPAVEANVDKIRAILLKRLGSFGGGSLEEI